MRQSLQSQAQSQNLLLENQSLLTERRNTLSQILLSLAAQRRRICLDLTRIYPIEPIDGALTFTIRGVKLPAAGKWGDVSEEQVATALGWCAHLCWLLTLYLGVPLRYPVQPVGGRSLVRDPVSIMMGSRTYVSNVGGRNVDW